MGNKNLNNAKKAKQDEFYTQLVDIEKLSEWVEFCEYLYKKLPYFKDTVGA